MRVIFMGVGIPKIHQKSIPKELCDVPVIALHHLRTGGLIRTNYVPVLFGVELAGESSRIHQVTEEHGELTAFGFGRGRGDWYGLAPRRRNVRRGRRRPWRGGWGGAAARTRPRQGTRTRGPP